ncbi:MAG: PAS domain-containing protein [Sedimentitalea sp.]|nr:PAS domain-containing protein [Sedimentitalea sp.]
MKLLLNAAKTIAFAISGLYFLAMNGSKEEMQSLNREMNTINLELQEKIAQLAAANTDLRNFFEATQIATMFLDADLVIRSFTPAAGTLFDVRSGDIGRPLTELASLRDYPALPQTIAEVVRTGDVHEQRLTCTDGEAHYLARVNPYLSAQEEISGAIVTFIDVTGLAEAEERQGLLIAELNHRVKNMLTVAISLVKMTLRKTGPDAAAREALIGRLHAMARSYELLSDSAWTRVSLRDIVTAELEAFDDDRVSLSGPRVDLTSGQATAIGMIMHELATNAAKYGALSNGSGQVRVTWQRDDGEIALQWREIGGPAVEPPEQTGFGIVLIKGQIEHQLDGQIDADFDPEGLHVSMTFRLKP